MTENMRVPFMDLQAQYQEIKSEIGVAISVVLDSSAYALGPKVKEFESDFASYCDARYAVGCNSGTSALHLALMAHGIGPGDEVITVSHTFIATAWAITYCGASPVFVDIDPKTKTIDVSLIEERISPRTKAIIPVHLYGHPADMNPILEIAERHELAVIEDAAQAHGALYKGRRVGSIGSAGCFSFYPGKNLGAYGEAGAVVTNDEGVAKKIGMLRDHGQVEKYHHEMIGYNYRMDGIQGAVLGVKLKYLDGWNAKRREFAGKYDELLGGIDTIVLPVTSAWAEPVFHLYVVEVSKKDRIRESLDSAGVNSGLHYPIPVHLQKAYAHLGYKPGSLPVTEKIAESCLSLPIYPEMGEERVVRVCNVLKETL